LFTGRRYDAETSWYHYRTRYLDPAAGRFTTRDTIGIWGDSREFGNAYVYVASSPASWMDSFGLAPFKWFPVGPGTEPKQSKVQEWSNDWSDIGALLDAAKNAKPKPLTQTEKYLKAYKAWQDAFEQWLNHQRGINRLKGDLCEIEAMEKLMDALSLIDLVNTGATILVGNFTPRDIVSLTPSGVLIKIDNALLADWKADVEWELANRKLEDAPHPGSPPVPSDFGIN
jgi:RHS repeat-associated protein